MNVVGYGGLERGLDEERCLCGRMKGEVEELFGCLWLGIAHGRANLL